MLIETRKFFLWNRYTSSYLFLPKTLLISFGLDVLFVQFCGFLASSDRWPSGGLDTGPATLRTEEQTCFLRVKQFHSDAFASQEDTVTATSTFGLENMRSNFSFYLYLKRSVAILQMQMFSSPSD